MRFKFFLIFVSIVFLNSCATTPEVKVSSACDYTVEKTDAINQLNTLSDLYTNSCYSQVIELGNSIRENFRDKKFSLTTETLSIFVNESVFVPYVLETHERSLLTLLISISHFNLKNFEMANIELRRSLNENNAMIYNYGDDPVLLALQAAYIEKIWTVSDSRPLWKKISEHQKASIIIKDYALNRLSKIDNNTAQPTKVYKAGAFPELDWKINWSTIATKQSNAYYSIYPKEDFQPDCSSDNTAVISTESWLNKLKYRHNSDYHPLLNLKSWVRVPVGLAYGGAMISGGLAVATIGCGVGRDHHNGGLCDSSIKAGAYMIQGAGTAFTQTVEPDMRHWSNLPKAFIFSNKKPEGTKAPDNCIAESLGSQIIFF
jgi:hypothetical protein